MRTTQIPTDPAKKPLCKRASLQVNLNPSMLAGLAAAGAVVVLLPLAFCCILTRCSFQMQIPNVAVIKIAILTVLIRIRIVLIRRIIVRIVIVVMQARS